MFAFSWNDPPKCSSVVSYCIIARLSKFYVIILPSQLRYLPSLFNDFEEMEDTIVVEHWFSYHDISKFKPPSSDVKLVTEINKTTVTPSFCVGLWCRSTLHIRLSLHRPTPVQLHKRFSTCFHSRPYRGSHPQPMSPCLGSIHVSLFSFSWQFKKYISGTDRLRSN